MIDGECRAKGTQISEEHRQRIERDYLKVSRRNTYIACEDLDLVWDLKVVMRFDESWNNGYPIDMIADALGRDVDEVAILAMDRARKGKIGIRNYDAYGGKANNAECV